MLNVSINNKTQLALWVLCASFIAYILYTLLAAIFVYAIPMSQDRCDAYMLEVIASEGFDGDRLPLASLECYGPDNEIERQKYQYNALMDARANKISYFNLLLISVLTWGIFFFKNPNENSGVGGAYSCLAIGVFSVFVLGGIPRLILPHPDKWIPIGIAEFNDRKVRTACASVIKSSLGYLPSEEAINRVCSR